jgi:DNA-binding IclR family transcriptional regulator
MPYTVPVVEKAVALLNAIAAGQKAQSIQQLAAVLKISPSTCYRIVRTLEACGWIAQRSGGGWTLSVGLLPVRQALDPMQSLIDSARPVLLVLARAVGLSCKLSVRRGDHAVTLVRGEAPTGIGISGSVGSEFPLTLGSSGAALLADLDEDELEKLVKRASKHAWAHQTIADFRQRVMQARSGKLVVDRGSYSPHVHSISLPIRNAADEVIAAVTVLGLPEVMASFSKASLQKSLQSAVRQIEASERSADG